MPQTCSCRLEADPLAERYVGLQFRPKPGLARPQNQWRWHQGCGLGLFRVEDEDELDDDASERGVSRELQRGVGVPLPTALLSRDRLKRCPGCQHLRLRWRV